MEKLRRLAHLNEVIHLSRHLGVQVADVHFGWGFDVLVIMRHCMPEAIRSRHLHDPQLDYAMVDYDPNYPGWASYHEVLMDRESKVAIIFPRPQDQLEAHKAELRSQTKIA